MPMPPNGTGGAIDRKQGCTPPEGGIHPIGMRGARDRNEGGDQSARRGRAVENGGSTDRIGTCHRPPRVAHAIAIRGAAERNAAPPSGNAPATDRMFPLHFSERHKSQRRNDLTPRGGTPDFEMCHPSFEHADPPFEPGASPPAIGWI